jgi:hypothetical protein
MGSRSGDLPRYHNPNVHATKVVEMFERHGDTVDKFTEEECKARARDIRSNCARGNRGQ